MDPADSSSSEHVVDDPVREAISTINDVKGVAIDGIYEFAKARRHDLMPNYKDVLEVELNKLVSRNELEMVDNLYKIAHVVSSEPDTETKSEPVADPANTPSKTPSSSGDTHDDDMILDAIKEVNDGNGANVDEIYTYIKGKYHIDPDDRKALEDDLNDLVRRNTLEMVDNLYRYIHVSSQNKHETSEPATEAESELVAVADPANTSSDAATSSSAYDNTVEETLERTGQVELDRSVAEREEAEIQKLQRGIDMTRLIIEEIPNRELFSGFYDNNRVTIKTLPADIDFGDLCKQFDLSRNLEHKNVGKVLGIGTTRLKTHYLVMEYLPLPTVFDFLHEEKGTFEYKDLLKVATETAEAMQYLHEQNIFYGGLETKNLLRNEEGVVKICGLSHLAERLNWDLKKVKRDVLNFGIVLWELLTGEIPGVAGLKLIKQKISDGFERTWKEDPPSEQECMKAMTDLLFELVPSDAHPAIVHIIKRCWNSYDQISFKGIGDFLKMISKEKKKSRFIMPCF